MMIERRNDILRRQRLAIVELHALSDLEGPRLRVWSSLPAFGQFWDKVPIGRYFSEVVSQSTILKRDLERLSYNRRVQRIGRRPAVERQPQNAAPFRLRERD